VNVTTDTVFTVLGEIAEPVFNLITTPTTDFNEIMLLLDRTDITKASELMADIPNCSGVARWNATLQGYEQYIPGIPPTDFPVYPGYPYYVNVTADVIWPEGGVPKVSFSSQTSFTTQSGTQAPHAVFGKYSVLGDSLRGNDITFIAYIESRPDEKLTSRSTGCFAKDGRWLVQCASFPSPWDAGESLVVEFQEPSGFYQEAVKITLTYNSTDEAQDIILSKNNLIPQNMDLCQNFPNPFNAVTQLNYQLSEPTEVSIRIYNMLGQEICVLFHKKLEAGYYHVRWNGTDSNNNPVSDGVYLARLEAGNFVKTRKMLLVK
jgi:hypothetical protein